MEFRTLEHPNANAHFDPESHIAFITYQGSLSADASSAVYAWLGELSSTVGLEQVYGEVFDFRQVTEFMPDNLMEARKKSRQMNLRMNVKKLPVAMIVKDFYQEEILRGPMQNVEENRRKTIVRSMEDALSFIEKWHAEQAE